MKKPRGPGGLVTGRSPGQAIRIDFREKHIYIQIDSVKEKMVRLRFVGDKEFKITRPTAPFMFMDGRWKEQS